MHSFYADNFIICPRCGAKFTQLEDHLHCEACQFNIYPHPSPATAVFIFNEKKQILLNKRRFEPQKGYWDSVGGFVNTNESIEEGAIREVKEETTLNVKIEKIIGTVPDIYQGTPTVTIAFLASITSGTPIASDDAEVLEWFDIDDLPTDQEIAFESVAQLLKKSVEMIKQL
jgi:ADP-ribose pyrophosphatase YjhB (NUDIX family)